MNDVRTLLFAVLIYIIHIEVFSNGTVKLNGDHGIFFTVNILCLNINLRSIECSFAVCFYERNLLLFQKLTKDFLCGFPVMLIAKIFLLVFRIRLRNEEELGMHDVIGQRDSVADFSDTGFAD